VFDGTKGTKGDDVQESEQQAWTRRRFLQVSAASVVATGLTDIAHAEAPSAPTPSAPTPNVLAPDGMIDVPFEGRDPRVAVIGVGKRGTSLLGDLLATKAKITAVCDLAPEKAEHAASMVVTAGQTKPALYTDGPHSFNAMLTREDVDLVIVATPWSWHAEMAVSAMQHGKHVAVEVPGVTTLDDCWRIVNTSEATRKHCVILENCCYGYNETLILRMVHAGLFGDLLYGEGAYLHDLRDELFSKQGEGLWRRTEHTLRNGNLYPSHGLGPVCNYMGIHRGDRLGYIVSMSTPQRGLDAYRKEHLQADDPRWAEKYVTGDMNTSLIKTVNGLTITLKHTVSTPHPYDRINLIAGTRGVFEDYPARIYLDGQNKDESWATIDAWKQYQHPLWKREGERAQNLGGHGGMDYIMLYRLLQCFREGLPPDLDVYDTAAWSAIAPLSASSVSRGSAPMEFPDFTKGKWKQRKASAIATQV
jgi:predicted dehydrogenase